MPPKRKHQQQQEEEAETEHNKAAAPEDPEQAGGASEEKAKAEEDEGVGQAEPKRRRVVPQKEGEGKGEEKGGGEVVAKEEEEKKKKNVEGGGEVQPYEFAWDKFTKLPEAWDTVSRGEGAGFTGAEPGVSVCDEPVDEALVRAGLVLLNAATGPWHEDADEGRRRTKQVATSYGYYEDSVVRVYRAPPAPSTDPHNEADRFELTFLQCPGFAHFEYVFVVDKVKRRFVFAGESDSHPQAGTNDFVYHNSDGRGPGLLPDSSVPPTPTTLLDAARHRFSEFCLDHHH